MPRRQKVTDDQLRDHVAAGWRADQIAAQYGCATWTVQRRCRAIGLNVLCQNPADSAGVNKLYPDSAFIDAHAAGLSQTEAARRIGCSVQTVGARARALGLRFAAHAANASKHTVYIPTPRSKPNTVAARMAEFAAAENAAMRRRDRGFGGKTIHRTGV